jgi:hypothetical protein
VYVLIKGKGNLVSRSITRTVTVKKGAGSVETIGSHEGLESGEQNQPERRIKALDVEVVKSNKRIIENGTKSVK